MRQDQADDVPRTAGGFGVRLWGQVSWDDRGCSGLLCADHVGPATVCAQAFTKTGCAMGAWASLGRVPLATIRTELRPDPGYGTPDTATRSSGRTRAEASRARSEHPSPGSGTCSAAAVASSGAHGQEAEGHHAVGGGLGNDVGERDVAAHEQAIGVDGGVIEAFEELHAQQAIRVDVELQCEVVTHAGARSAPLPDDERTLKVPSGSQLGANDEIIAARFTPFIDAQGRSLDAHPWRTVDQSFFWSQASRTQVIHLEPLGMLSLPPLSKRPPACRWIWHAWARDPTWRTATMGVAPGFQVGA